MIYYNFISHTSWYTQECQSTTQESRVQLRSARTQLRSARKSGCWILSKFVEMSKPVEKGCRIQSKNVVETSRNKSKQVEICRNLSKPVEKCCRNVENVFFDFSYPIAIRVKKLPAGSIHTHVREWNFFGIFFGIFFEIFLKFFLNFFGVI